MQAREISMVSWQFQCLQETDEKTVKSSRSAGDVNLVPPKNVERPSSKMRDECVGQCSTNIRDL